MPLSPRLSRELKTINTMVQIYCRSHHNSSKTTICENCTEFFNYAQKRLSRCPFKELKPTCGKCPIHCYNKEMQVKARQIMRFSGPRMIWKHPIMAFFHILDGRKRIPDIRSCRRADQKQQNK